MASNWNPRRQQASAAAAVRALGRMKQGAMNRTEKAYEDVLKLDPDVIWYKFEGVKFRLADKTFYTPDFSVLRKDGTMQIHEVKGFWTDDARVKIKVAADMYPFEFIAVKKKAKKDGGGWAREEF